VSTRSGAGNDGGAALWVASGAVVLAAHVGVAALLLCRGPQPAEGTPSDAILVDLSPDLARTQSLADASGQPAPEPVSPSDDTAEASTPEPPSADAPPPTSADEQPPEPRVEPFPDLDPPPPIDTAVVLPVPEPKRPVEREAAPPRQTMPSEARPPTVQSTAGGGRLSTARIATWKSDLALRLAHRKRYPAEAQARHQQGVATIRFTLDGAGRVLSCALVRSSGVASLDDESIALVHRAEPFPPPPPGMPAPIEIEVPIKFSFR
jgi:periplasmic protein TonB